MHALAILSALLAVLALGCGQAPAEDPPWGELRGAMVREQLAARGIDDQRVLAAMGQVPRHLFVPPGARAMAYDDGPLPIGLGQTISQPYVVALMSQALALTGTEKVLEVGTGSGYQAAVLSRLAGAVYTVEIEPELARRAGEVLRETGCADVRSRVGDGRLGWPEAAPFQAIIVTAAGPSVPPELWRQLAVGGRLVMPVGDPGAVQQLMLVRKGPGGGPVSTVLIPVRFVPLRGRSAEGGH